MDFIWIIAIVFVVGIIGGIIQHFDSKQKKEQRESKVSEGLKAISGFSPEKTIVKKWGKTDHPIGLSIDSNSRQVCIIQGATMSPIPFSTIIGSEVVVDGATVTKTSRGGQIAGAAVGGLLLGGVGAIIGGLSASTTSSQQIKSVIFRLRLNSIHQPTHDIEMIELQSDSGAKIPAIFLEQALREADEWNNAVKVIVFQNESGPSQTSADPDAEMKACPFCAEKIRQAAVLCRYCGQNMPPT